LTHLHDTSTSKARDIDLLDGTVYVAGYHYDGSKKIAVVWEDGTGTTLFDTGTAGVNAEALAVMAVK